MLIYLMVQILCKFYRKKICRIFIYFFFCNLRIESPKIYFQLLKYKDKFSFFSIGLSNFNQYFWSIATESKSLDLLFNLKHSFFRFLSKRGKLSIIKGYLVRESQDYFNVDSLYSLFLIQLRLISIKVSTFELFHDKTQFLSSMSGITWQKQYHSSTMFDWEKLRFNGSIFFSFFKKKNSMIYSDYLDKVLKQFFYVYFNLPVSKNKNRSKDALVVSFSESFLFSLSFNVVDVFYPISNIIKTGGLFLNVFNNWQYQRSQYMLRFLKTYSVSLNVIFLIIRSRIKLSNYYACLEPKVVLNLPFHYKLQRSLENNSDMFLFSFLQQYSISNLPWYRTRDILIFSKFFSYKIVTLSYDSPLAKSSAPLILQLLKELVSLRSIYNIGFRFKKIFKGDNFFFYEDCSFNYLTFRQRFFARVGFFERLSMIFTSVCGFLTIVLASCYLIFRLLFDLIGPVVVKLTFRFYFFYKFIVSSILFLFLF